MPAVTRSFPPSPADMQSRFVHISAMLKQFGPHVVREPYVKPLGGKQSWPASELSSNSA